VDHWWKNIMVTGTRYDVVVVVVTFNSAQYIRQCIDSIKKHFDGSGFSTSIVVVDNASADGSRQILADLEKTVPGIRIILLDENIGFGSANNVGFRAVPARYYVLINSDAWLIADSISPVFQAMQARPGIAVCGLPLIYPDGVPQTYAYRFSSWQRWMLMLLGVRSLAAKLMRFRWVATILAHLPYGGEFVRSQSRPKLSIAQIADMHCSGELRSVDWVCGAAMVIAGDFIRESGGFDPAIFLYGEDEDLCIAAHRAGRDVMVADVPPVVHVFGWGLNRFNRRVADLKYLSLRYFIAKNVHGALNRLLMLNLLPFYVYGVSRWYLAWYVRKVGL
jgi:N-acetylglucosaminyl-diphospho-decaprenol L-rhamnosyltransferase